MAKKIIHIPNDVLNTPAKTVTKFDTKLKTLITEMSEALIATKRPKGVGLAAPQVGEPYRIFLTKPTAKSQVHVFINPEIVGLSEKNNDTRDSKKDSTPLEGCLSIPDIWGHVTRAHSVTLKYQDSDGKFHEEVFDGFLATIIQHETDHTNGILFTQRVLEQHQRLYHSTRDDQGKEVLEEIAI